MRQIFMATAFSLIAASCAPPQPYVQKYYPNYQTGAATAALRTYVVVEDTEFDKDITLKGVQERHGPDELGIPFRTYMLRSWVSKETGDASHQLYFDDYYEGSGWRFWNRASDQDANILKTVVIDRSVGYCSGRGGCSHYETVGVTIPDTQLRKYVDSGYRVRMNAKDGSEKVLLITSEQIRKQLEQIEFRQPKKPAAKQP